MASENRVFDVPFVASSNVTSITYSGNPAAYSSGGIGQYCAVVTDTATGNSRDIKVATANTAIALGINQSSTVLAGSGGPGAITAGDTAEVRVLGISKAQASGAITVGQSVMVANSSGQLGPASAAGVSNVYIVGVALSAATAANDLFDVLLLPGAATQVNA